MSNCQPRRLTYVTLIQAVFISFALVSPFAARAAIKTRTTEGVQLLVLVIENRGTIRVELLPSAAPKTVAHIKGLADKHFYDGILFHRVEQKSLVQAGDPATRKIDGKTIAKISPAEASQLYGLGAGGSGKTVPLEATLPCVRGTLGLARNMSLNSGDSQFFFNLVDNHKLDNQYCVFGRVVIGLDVMDRIRQGDRIKSMRIELQQPRSPTRRP